MLSGMAQLPYKEQIVIIFRLRLLSSYKKLMPSTINFSLLY